MTDEEIAKIEDLTSRMYQIEQSSESASIRAQIENLSDRVTDLEP